jgi:hypothetical protein
MRRLRFFTRFAFPWQKSRIAQVCRCAADGVAGEPYKSKIHKIQIQPIEQPSAEDFGGEAA